MKQTVQQRLNEHDKQINSFLVDFQNFKIRNAKSILDAQEEIRELKKETITLSRVSGALLDLLSDTTSIPKNLIAERFMFYNQERHPVDEKGKIKGSIKVTGYNLGMEEK